MPHVMTALSALVAAICGAAIGVLFTVAHRATIAIGPIGFPYGIVLGLIAAIGFLVAMRLLWDTRWPALGGALGLVAAIGVLSFAGAGGSVIVGDDAFGWTWLIAPTLASAVVVAWPRRRARRAAPDTMEEPGTNGLEPAEDRL